MGKKHCYIRVFEKGRGKFSLMNSWLPTLIKGVGFSIRDAALIGAMGQVGGVVGNIGIG
jgi:hypothetical protein